MKADEHILGLPYRALGSRELLPELAGIYYVLDEKLIIWYIGQAKNLRTRWAGESHHRLYQLQKQRKNQFVIYYELVAESQLNVMEQQRIEQYNPLLNRTRVKTQKLQPTETLLRETLVILGPYSFVLGVEPPRKQDRHFIEDSVDWRDKWLLTIGGMYIFHEHQNTPDNESNRREMERLSPYKQDLVKLLFNEELDTSKLQIFPTDTARISKN